MKSGVISALGGVTNPVALDAAIIPPTLNTSTLASLVSDILAGSQDLLCLMIDFTARKIVGKVTTEGGSTGIHDSVTGVATHDFVKDDLTKASSTWTVDDFDAFVIGDGEEDPFQDLLKPALPKVTTSGLIGLIEDAILTEGGPLEGAFIVAFIDQGSASVRVAQYDTAPHAVLGFNNLGSPTIGYQQTIPEAGATTRQPLE